MTGSGISICRIMVVTALAVSVPGICRGAPLCEIRGYQWQPPLPLEDANGHGFAEFGGPVSARLVPGAARHELTVQVGVELNGWISARVPIKPVVPTRFRVDGVVFLAAGAQTALPLQGGSISVEMPAFLTRPSGAALKPVRVPCRALALLSVPVPGDDARPTVPPGLIAALGEKLSPELDEAVAHNPEARVIGWGTIFPWPAAIADQPPLEIAARPGGKPVVRLAPSAPWPIAVLAEKGKWLRISLRRGPVVLDGWIERDRAAWAPPPPVEPSEGPDLSSLALAELIGRGDPGNHICRGDPIALFYRQAGGARVRIGRVLSNATLDLSAAGADGWAEVKVTQDPVSPPPGVVWEIRGADAARCDPNGGPPRSRRQH